MAIDRKLGTFQIPGVPDDEPVFVIRGQDAAAVPAIAEGYRDAAQVKGAARSFLDEALLSADVIDAWQDANPDRVKVPD